MVTDYNGILFIVLAAILIIGEILAPVTFGALMTAGIISLIIGLSVMYGGIIYLRPWHIVFLVMLSVGFLIFAIIKAIHVHRVQAYTGEEALIGKTAIVKVKLIPQGMVFLDGELWTAISESGEIDQGNEVTITRMKDNKLYVTNKQ